MKAYFLSVLGAGLLASMVGLLAPNGTQKQIKLVASLLLVCVLVTPLPRALQALQGLSEDLSNGLDDSLSEDYEQKLEDALNSASGSYFADSLTTLLCDRFSIPSGELRCAIRWSDDRDVLRPESVTLILSGSAIWKNPAEMEAFVTELLGCECVSAIE